MKVLLLAPATSIHTQRWAEGLARRGMHVVVATQHPDPSWDGGPGLDVAELPFRGQLGYFLNVLSLRSVLATERPDVMNVHYASGYGTTASLTGFKPYLLSVWGSDVFDFPHVSRLKKRLLQRNLVRATGLASTSEVMRDEVMALAPGVMPPFVTPFGVDTSTFVPRTRAPRDYLVIGTVKALYKKYGIDVLIEAVAEVNRTQVAEGTPPVRVRIVGSGPELPELRELARRLGISETTEFAGALSHASVPDALNDMDVFVAASRLDSESFGVAVVEACAVGLPVIVSAVAGLSEVVIHGTTGFVVPKDDAPALAQAIRTLLLDEIHRAELGAAGRALVVSRYEWERCLDLMIEAYEKVISHSDRNRSATGL